MMRCNDGRGQRDWISFGRGFVGKIRRGRFGAISEDDLVCIGHLVRHYTFVFCEFLSLGNKVGDN